MQVSSSTKTQEAPELKLSITKSTQSEIPASSGASKPPIVSPSVKSFFKSKTSASSTTASPSAVPAITAKEAIERADKRDWLHKLAKQPAVGLPSRLSIFDGKFSRQKWHKRLFVLCGNTLFYFKTEEVCLRFLKVGSLDGSSLVRIWCHGGSFSCSNIIHAPRIWINTQIYIVFD